MHMYEFRTVLLVAFDPRHASVDHLLLNHSVHIRTRLKRPINGAFRLVVVQ